MISVYTGTVTLAHSPIFLVCLTLPTVPDDIYQVRRGHATGDGQIFPRLDSTREAQGVVHMILICTQVSLIALALHLGG